MLTCMITLNAENFHFGLLNDSDIVSINTSNSMQINDMIPEFETIQPQPKLVNYARTILM